MESEEKRYIERDIRRDEEREDIEREREAIESNDIRSEREYLWEYHRNSSDSD